MSRKAKAVLVVLKAPMVPIKRRIPSFHPLPDLRLEFLENKKKLKPGLPLIPRKPIVVKQSKEDDKDEEEDEDRTEEDSGGEDESISEEEKKSKKGREKQDEEDDEEIPDDEEPLEDEDSVLVEEDEEEGEKAEEGEKGGEGETASPLPGPNDREEYVWRFRLLKKSYPHRKDIPDFNEFSDLEVMKSAYTRITKDIAMDKKLSFWQKSLIWGFKSIEFVSVNMFNVDIEGFANQQIAEIDGYNEMLIELGDRPYTNVGSSFPIEMRLVLYMLMQAALFYILKLGVGNAGLSPTARMHATGDDGRMKGPNINLEDIEKMKKD